jgi:hypothetical protein
MPWGMFQKPLYTLWDWKIGRFRQAQPGGFRQVERSEIPSIGIEDSRNGAQSGGMEGWVAGLHLPFFQPSIRAGFLLSYQVQTHLFRNLKLALKIIQVSLHLLSPYKQLPIR